MSAFASIVAGESSNGPAENTLGETANLMQELINGLDSIIPEVVVLSFGIALLFSSLLVLDYIVVVCSHIADKTRFFTYRSVVSFFCCKSL